MSPTHHPENAQHPIREDSTRSVRRTPRRFWKRTRTFVIALLVCTTLTSVIFYNRAHAASTYFSQGSLAPNLTTSWNSLPGGGGVQPANFTSGDVFVIQNGHNMTTSAAWSLSGSGSILQIANGGTLTATSAVTLAAATLFQIDAGGTYVHGNATAYGSTIFQGTESFAAGSTVILANSNATGPTGVTFGNLTVNAPTVAGSIQCGGGITSIAGNLTIVNTSASEFRLAAGSPAALTVTIGGDLVISGGTLNLVSGATVMTLNVAGKFEQTGGTFTATGAGPHSINFTGGSSPVNFNRPAGTFTVTNINWTIASGKTVQFNNNFTLPVARTFTIASGGALAEAAVFLNSGIVTVNGAFQFNQGGSATGNSFVYGGSSTLVFNNTSGSFVVSGDPYWPASSGPPNVTVQGAGGITMNVARTVSGLFQYAAGVSSASNLTFNGTSQINPGGFAFGSPTYGGASLLKYNTGGNYGRNGEWLPGATSGAGYPNHVQLSNNTTLDLPNSFTAQPFQISGSLTIDAGSMLQMAGATPLTQALTVVGSLNNIGNLILSTAAGGDLHLQGDFTNNGTITPNNRALFFEGNNTQDVTDASGTLTMPYVCINKGGNSVVLQSNLTALGTGGGDSLQFLGTTNIVTLNSKTLTLGSTVGTPPAGSGLYGDAAANLSLQDGGTGPGGAMGTIAFVNGGQSLNNLTLNRTGAIGSATLGSPLTINGSNGALALTAGIINTGANTLTMGGDATSTGAHNGVGASYVDGTMKKIYDVVPKNFTFDLGSAGGTTDGYTPAAVDAQALSAVGEVTATATNAFAPFTNTGKALRRYWSLTNNGLTLVNLTFTYLDGDVPGTANEAIFVPYKIDGFVSTNPVGAVNAALNTISVPSATSFSDWTAAEPNEPTAVKLTKFNGTSYADGVQLNWESGFEVNNLGYHLHREQLGRRTRVTPAVVAGSALTVGPGSRLTAGYSYSWFDQKGTADTAYYLESIDLNGAREWTGPIYPYGGATRNLPKRQRARLINELADSFPASEANAVRAWPAMKVEESRERLTLTTAGLAVQQSIASGEAVKIEVNRTGWYRLSQPELIAAGWDPDSDARLLQLYADGVEVPIELSNNGPHFDSNDTLEFYGVALDTPTTDTRTYWLITGDSAGKRIKRSKPKEGSPGSSEAAAVSSFSYTMERREKLVYLSHLLNGDGDNIFGAPVLNEPVQQTLTINNLDSQSNLPAQLEVALQGLTAHGHQVRVQFNGSDVGTVTFSGADHPVVKFNVNSALLRLGDNQVSLVSQNGDLDISFIDSIRLTYAHQYRADNNALAFSLAGGQTVRVVGFTKPKVRVIDVTDPSTPLELVTNSGSSRGGYAVVVPPANEARTLIAFTDDLSRHPAAVMANNPSDWTASTNGADLIIITHKDFCQAIEPLATLRRNQDLSVAVVDVEDVYDEFSYGAHTPLALKSFLSQATLNWSRKPQHLLLVGDSSWDPRNYFDLGANDFVPTKLIDTGYMETASDDWFADFNGAGLASMAIGRLPAQTPADVSLMVAKILSYEQERDLNVPLRGAIMISDNGFENQSVQTQSLLPSGIDVQTISRTQIGNDDLMRIRILSALDQGPMIVNYYGHGSVGVWTGAALLDRDSAAGLTNVNRFSLFVLMTCLNGYSHDAYVDSLAESLLKAPNGGAVAVWASSGFTDPQPQFGMDLEFYRQSFGAQPLRLGEAIRNAKAAVTNSDVRRTWVLLGDPTMRIR